MRKLPLLVLGSLVVGSVQAAGADFVSPKTDEEMIANEHEGHDPARSATPGGRPAPSVRA